MAINDRIREAITSASDDPALIFALVAIAEAIQENTETQREIADSSLRAAENFFRLGMGEADDLNKGKTDDGD